MLISENGLVTAWDIASMLSEQPDPPVPVLEHKLAKGNTKFRLN